MKKSFLGFTWYVAPVRGFHYKIGNAYATHLNVKPCVLSGFYVEDGFHSFGTKDEAEKYALEIGLKKGYIVGEFVIPKNSHYFIGSFGCSNNCYVSDHIKFIGYYDR